jgi:hypothetical protein
MDISFSITGVLKASVRRQAILGECLRRRRRRRKKKKKKKKRVELRKNTYKITLKKPVKVLPCSGMR